MLAAWLRTVVALLVEGRRYRAERDNGRGKKKRWRTAARMVSGSGGRLLVA